MGVNNNSTHKDEEEIRVLRDKRAIRGTVVREDGQEESKQEEEEVCMMIVFLPVELYYSYIVLPTTTSVHFPVRLGCCY